MKRSIRIKVMNVAATALGILPRPVLKASWGVLSLMPGPLGIVLRYAVVRRCAARCGENVYIARFVVLKHLERLSLGSNVSIHESCYFDAFGEILIGSNVSIAHQSSILSFNHTWDDLSKPIKYNPLTPQQVVINDDVWLGCGVRILPGAALGTRSVVAAGCVVNRVFGPGSVVAGVPARVIRMLPLADQPHEEDDPSRAVLSAEALT